MNAIYERSRNKRKYTKKPLCGHTEGFCTGDTCRMNYAIKAPKGKLPPLDKTFKHRDKVVKIMRAKELQKLDSELYKVVDNGTLNATYNEMLPGTFSYIGEYSKQKVRQAKYERMAWRVLWILCGLVLLIGIFLN